MMANKNYYGHCWYKSEIFDSIDCLVPFKENAEKDSNLGTKNIVKIFKKIQYSHFFGGTSTDAPYKKLRRTVLSPSQLKHKRSSNITFSQK